MLPPASRAPSRASAPPRRRARRSSASRSCSSAPYFCQIEDHKYFELAEAIPGPTTEALGKVAAELGVVIVAVALREARRGPLSQHRGDHRRRRHATSASTGRCTSRTTRRIYEKFYFTPGDLGFRAWRHAVRPHRRAASAGTSGIPRPRGSRRLRGAQILFYPTAIGWHPAGEGGVRRAAARCVGDDPARATRSPTAATSPRVNRVGHEATDRRAASSSGARASSPIPAGSIIAKARRGRRGDRRAVRPRRARRRSARTGRSCATAASTPTATSRSASSTDA